MDWKAQIASSIEAAVQASVEAALQRSRYAPVEESADETARRRTSWFGEAGRRRIELAEDRARRDPVWAEKMARRHAAFRDALASTAAPAPVRTATAGAASAQLEPDLSTSMPGTAASTSTAPPSVLTACAVCAGNLAARPPTTCSTKCPGRAAVVPELAAPAVSDKAFDVDAMCDTTRSAAVCLPAGPDHNICGEDLVSKSLTLCSAPTYFSSLPGNPPSSTCEPTDVLEPFMWSFTSCSTIRSGHSLKMPPSLMPEAYMEFSIGPNVSTMAPWPPPSCTRAGPSLIFGHDLCHNEQQKRSEEFSVMDSKENWNAIWLRVELKPPWLSLGVSTNLPVGWPDPPWPPPTPNKSTACKNFNLHSTLNIRLTSGDWQVFKTMELNLWLALLVSMFVPEVHSAHLQPLVCKWSVPFWYDTILLIARTTLNMKLDLLLTKRTTNTVWNWCCLDNLYAYLGSPNWALEEEQGQVFLRMSWQWFRYHWEAAYPMKPCSAIPFMFGKPPTGQPHLHGYDGNSILHYTNFSDENQLHVLVVLETFRSELFSVGYIWDCLQYEHLQQWRPPDQTTEFPEHWLIPWDPGEVLVQHLLNKTRPRMPISVSRAVDMTFPYVLVLEQQFHASWDPGGSNSRLFDDSPGHNLIEKFSSLSITCELQYSSSVVDSLLAARYWVWCMRCLQLDIDRPSKCVSNFQLKPPWSHFSSTIPTRFRLPEAYILLVDVEHGNNKDMNSWYDPLPSLGHVQFSLHCLFGTVQNPNGIMSTTSCLEVHILDAISISLSTSTLMHVGKFCLLLGQFSSCDQFVPESATDLGSQLFEWQIPWYSGLCSAIFSSNWLQMQPVGGHLKFNVDITSTIDSMPSIKHVSGMFSVALQYWEVVNYFAAAMLLMSSQLSEGWVLYLPVTCIMQCRSELMPWVLANSRDGILTYTKRVLIFQDPGGSVLVLHAGTGVNGNSSQQPFLLLTWDPGGYMQHRLEGKPNLKEGGIVNDPFRKRPGPDGGLPSNGFGPAQKLREEHYKREADDYDQLGLDQDGFGLLASVSSSSFLEGPRQVTPTILKEMTGLEAEKLAPKKWGLSGNSPYVLATFLGGVSFLLTQGVDVRPNLAAILGLATADALFLGGTCAAQISCFWPPYKRKILVHEAGHLLTAYLMGCPIRGVILDPFVALRMGIQGQAGTQFWDGKMEKELGEGHLSSTAFDRYCMILFAGIAAEALVYGEAEGGENDENLFRSLCILLNPPLSVAQMANRARWSVMQSYNLLKWHKKAHRAAIKALESGHSLSVVIRRIEEAISSDR